MPRSTSLILAENRVTGFINLDVAITMNAALGLAEFGKAFLGQRQQGRPRSTSDIVSSLLVGTPEVNMRTEPPPFSRWLVCKRNLLDGFVLNLTLAARDKKRLVTKCRKCIAGDRT